MVKTKAEYKVRSSVSENVPVGCSGCASIVGHLTQDDRLKLHGTTITVWAAHGVCSCGTEWHFSSNDAAFTRMVRRSKRPTVRERMQAARAEILDNA